jgi:hypothetical protein
MTAADPVHDAPALAVLRAALDAALGERGVALDAELARIAEQPTALHRLFPAAGRRYGRALLPGAPAGWRVEDAVRTIWLRAAALPPEPLAAEVLLLYRHGDAAERRGVLRALPYLPLGPGALEVVHDALRTNDDRLIAAAMGPYAQRHLDQRHWRQAVLKCLFTGVPLSAVAGLADRQDGELAALAEGFATERRAAGRPVPPDTALLLPGGRDGDGEPPGSHGAP